MSVGELIVRYLYPDGRAVTLITVGDDWKTEIFPSIESAKVFAKRNDLAYKEIPSGDSGE